MKRQKVRKASIIISFLLFPITIYYFSPYLIIQGASEGIITGSFIVFTAMFLFSLFFGRLFCGWACPAGGLQECCTVICDKKVKGGKRNWIKYFIWAPWISLIVFMIIKAGGLGKIDFFYQTVYGISISNPQSYVIYYGVVAIITVMAFLAGRRSFCHYICWMAPFMVIGRKISDKIKIPSLKLKAESKKCVQCKLCSKNCPMSLSVNEMVSDNLMKNNECILCGNCIDSCPNKVIHYTFKK